MKLIFCIYISIFICIAYASCPNHCNNKGTCDKYSKCTCATGYQGADCSERVCPFGTAWSDLATGIDQAHGQAECSNRGLCDRTNGKINCLLFISILHWDYNNIYFKIYSYKIIINI